jgi:hypothetical protein
MSEGVGLVLLVPLLSIATAANGGAGRLYDAVLRVLDLAGAQTRAGAAVAAASAFLSRSWCYGP